MELSVCVGFPERLSFSFGLRVLSHIVILLLRPSEILLGVTYIAESLNFY